MALRHGRVVHEILDAHEKGDGWVASAEDVAALVEYIASGSPVAQALAAGTEAEGDAEDVSAAVESDVRAIIAGSRRPRREALQPPPGEVDELKETCARLEATAHRMTMANASLAGDVAERIWRAQNGYPDVMRLAGEQLKLRRAALDYSHRPFDFPLWVSDDAKAMIVAAACAETSTSPDDLDESTITELELVAALARLMWTPEPTDAEALAFAREASAPPTGLKIDAGRVRDQVAELGGLVIAGTPQFAKLVEERVRDRVADAARAVAAFDGITEDERTP